MAGPTSPDTSGLCVAPARGHGGPQAAPSDEIGEIVKGKEGALEHSARRCV